MVGLGNPGSEYARTRHNVGFMVVDELARRFGAAGWKTKHGARQALVSERRVLLVEPVSFMNASGAPVKIIASWYRVEPAGVLVVSDDLDLPFGKLRMRAAGGSGGHNGLKSIIALLGEEFPRLRVGIGRANDDAIDRVLAPFDSSERERLTSVIESAADGVARWLEEGIEPAMLLVNSWQPS